MKTKSCGWRSPKSLGHRSYGGSGRHRRGRARMKGEGTSSVSSYMDHIANAASFEAICHHCWGVGCQNCAQKKADPLLSAETLPESNSFLSFSAFATEYPDRFFTLISHLRPEWQELAVEYYILHKSQAFIGKAHGEIQTRVWQQLRIVEQTIGSLILLGENPQWGAIYPILEKVGWENTEYGSLTKMILLYASSQSYAIVAKEFGAPIPAIRKIFRPAITSLLTDKDVKAIAVGAYLRGLVHQASLTGAGLSKRSQMRLRRVKTLRFTAPPSEDSPLISFGHTDALHEIPWQMLEISSDHRMQQISPLLTAQGRRLFGKRAAQIFAPINADGELVFGYIFARCVNPAIVRGLMKIRGISETAARYTSDGDFKNAVTIPNSDVQYMINKHTPPKNVEFRVNDFVRIETGDAKGYCGQIIHIQKTEMRIQVKFPTGRQFLIDATPNSVLRLDVPLSKQTFYGAQI